MPPKSNILIKSDFKVAQSCATKLFYRKNNYPTANDENEFLEYTAENGYLIGKLATLYYPDGFPIDHKQGKELAVKQTKELLKQDKVILFEASIYSNHKRVDIDILEKNGNDVNIIEVKSRGIDEFKENKWNEEIKDVAFQKMVFNEVYPEYNVSAYLFLPDMNKKTKIDKLNQRFEIAESEIIFKGNEEEVQKVRNDELMKLVNVDGHVNEILNDVSDSAEKYIANLKSERKAKPELSKKCFNCEYLLEGSQSGYHECWSEMSEPDHHHIRDLYFGGSIKKDGEFVINEMINESRLSLGDIDRSVLTGKRGERQKIQIENTLDNNEWISDKLKTILEDLEYPLHFIDFETITPVIPYYKDMSPYEMIAYQWSCHTIESPETDPIHSEFLNTENKYPNFDFAEQLKQQVGLDGTFLMWSHHENTTLKNIYYKALYEGAKELAEWMEEVVRFKGEPDGAGKFVDMDKLTLNHYFHPAMKGQTSIKLTLPAVLKANKSERVVRWLKEMGIYKLDEDGIIKNPYELLGDIELDNRKISMKSGTDAIKAYDEMLKENKEGDKEKIAEGLKKYCRLDTLSMVIIWKHWMESE